MAEEKNVQGSSRMGPAEAYPARDGRSWHLVSPDLRDVLEAWEPLGFSDENLAALRDTPADPLQPPPAPAVSERVIPGPADHPELAVVLVDPDPRRRDKPALLHIHGGGYVLGTALSSAPRLQTLAAEVGCLIVSVEYRLAPETRHPGALEDNYAALKWLMESADELGIDPGRIAVGGESAGGGHAAMLALAARDRAGPKIAFQWLIYPMLDDRTGSTRAVSPWQGEYIWSAKSNRYGWSSLLGVPAGSDEVPGEAVPGRREDLSGLPPTFIATLSLDLFLDENLRFAAALSGQGVAVDCVVQSGGYHGMDIFAPDAPSARRFTRQLVNGLKRGLAA